jgi:hypothetical protein
LKHRLDHEPNAVLERVTALNELRAAVEERAIPRLLGFAEWLSKRPLAERIDERIATLSAGRRAADDLTERSRIRDELRGKRLGGSHELIVQ